MYGYTYTTIFVKRFEIFAEQLIMFKIQSLNITCVCD